MASDSLCSVAWLHPPVCPAAVTWKTVGMASATAASVSVVVEVRAAVLLKRCSRNFIPPARIETPNTSRTLPMIEPVIDAFTTSVSPFESATSAIINSAALPKVAFNNPPTPWPRCSASSSVARPIQPARGTTARQEQMNKAVSFPNCGQIRSTTATGTKTSSQFIEGFSNDVMLVIHQVTGTHYNAEHKSLLMRFVTSPAFSRFLEKDAQGADPAAAGSGLAAK